MESKNIVRVPRAQGTTFLAEKFNNTKDDQDYRSLVQYIINKYVLSGFTYCTIPVDVYQFGRYLGIEHDYLLESMTNTADNLGFLNKDNSKQLMSMIASLTLEFSMQDRARVVNQFELLNKSQGNTYAPFISGEVNKSLKLLMESNAQIASTFNSFFNSNNSITNILNLIPKAEDPEENQEKLTVDKAVQLLSDNLGEDKALSIDSNARELAANELSEEYKLDLEDEVSARIVKDNDTFTDDSMIIDYKEEEHKQDKAHRRLKEFKPAKKSNVILPV